MKLLLNVLPAMLALLLASGCAHKPYDPSGAVQDVTWSAFQSKTADVFASRPAESLLSGSIRFGLPQDTRRVTYMLWSCPSREGAPGQPDLRLEVNAGAGPSICSAVWQNGFMTLLLHQKKQAWTGRDSQENLKKLLGIALPLELPRIHAFLAGQFYSALGKPQAPSRIDGNSFAFGRDSLISRMTLRADGSPERLQTWDGWDLKADYGTDGLPTRLDGMRETPDGDLRFLLLVKNRAPLNAAQPRAGLAIPDDYSLHDLDD